MSIFLIHNTCTNTERSKYIDEIMYCMLWLCLFVLVKLFPVKTCSHIKVTCYITCLLRFIPVHNTLLSVTTNYSILQRSSWWKSLLPEFESTTRSTYICGRTDWEAMPVSRGKYTILLPWNSNYFIVNFAQKAI